MKPTGYVVYGVEHLRDGIEEWGRVFTKIEDALAYLNKDFFAKGNMTFRLFELGKEVHITTEKTEVPQPSKVTERFVLKEKQQ